MQQTKKNIVVEFSSKKNGLQIEMETERLLVRSYEQEDFDKCVKLYEDKVLTRYFDNGEPRSRKEIEELIQDKTKYFLNFEPFGLFSIFRKEDMTFIGQIDVMPYEQPGVVELGCIFDRRYHNQGFCPEVLRAVIFEYIKILNKKGIKCNGQLVYKVMATVHPKNFASKRIIHNIGMQLDKTEERFGNPRLWYSLEPNLEDKVISCS